MVTKNITIEDNRAEALLKVLYNGFKNLLNNENELIDKMFLNPELLTSGK